MVVPCASSSTLAMPKSITLHGPRRLRGTMTFSGLRSRWTIGGSCPCAAASADGDLRARCSTRLAPRQRAASVSVRGASRPSRYSSTRTSCPSCSSDARLRTTFGCSRCARICISFRNIRRPSSSRDELGLQHLQRDAPLREPLFGLVDAAHPTFADEARTRYSPMRSMGEVYAPPAREIYKDYSRMPLRPAPRPSNMSFMSKAMGRREALRQRRSRASRISSGFFGLRTGRLDAAADEDASRRGSADPRSGRSRPRGASRRGRRRRRPPPGARGEAWPRASRPTRACRPGAPTCPCRRAGSGGSAPRRRAPRRRRRRRAGAGCAAPTSRRTPRAAFGSFKYTTLAHSTAPLRYRGP